MSRALVIALVMVMALVVVMACRAKKQDDPVSRFWTWFRDNASALRSEKDVEAAMKRINAQLMNVSKDVYAEVGMEGDERLLVITADGVLDHFADVERVVKGHPTVPGWRIVAFRQRSKPSEPFTLEMNGRSMSAADAKFVAQPVAAKLDVNVFLPGFDDSEQANKLGFVVMDHTIGEYDMETKIGGITFAPLEKAPPGARPLTELPAAVDALH